MTYSVVKESHFSGAVDLQILHFEDPVALDCKAECFFQLVKPQMVIGVAVVVFVGLHVGMVIGVAVVVFVGLHVGDHQEADKSKAGNDKPSGGLHRDKSGAVVAQDLVEGFDLVKGISCRKLLLLVAVS